MGFEFFREIILDAYLACSVEDRRILILIENLSFFNLMQRIFYFEYFSNSLENIQLFYMPLKIVILKMRLTKFS